jgi:hypothetical protein
MFRCPLVLFTLSFLGLVLPSCGEVRNDAKSDALSAGGNDQTDPSGVGRGRGGTATAVDAAVLPPGPSADASLPAVCNQVVCDDINLRYLAGVATAQGCQKAAVAQCKVSVFSGLSCAGCKVWVNGDTALKVLRKEWDNQGCAACSYPCPLPNCGLPTTGLCTGDSTGTIDPGSLIPGGILNPGLLGPVNDGMCVDE